MKASDLFVKALENEGVEYIFGIPGEENLDFLDSLSRSPIKLILTRHEQAAGFMAATLGRLTGKVGVCLSTLGPGATNLVTAAAYAQLGGMPMLMVTGQKPIKSSKQGQFQIIDVVDMMQPITKYSQQIASGDNIPSRIREAFRLAAEEKPGAAHLELPEDIAAEETNRKPIDESLARRPVAESKAVASAINLLTAAKHPLLVIAAGANRKLTATQLREFVDRQRIPFITTQMGKGVVDERHELFLGNATLSAGDFLHRAIEKADVIVNIGHDVVEKPPFFMDKGERQVIHVNFNSAAVDPVYFPQIEVIGDIANSIWQINEGLVPQENWDFEWFMKCRAATEEHISEGSDAAEFPVRPQRLVADVRSVMPDNGIIALDNGVYKIWFARNYKAHRPNTVLLDNALASMGAGLPSAIAAKIVHPDRPVIAICGDGGFMMNSQELETAVRLGLDLIVLILNDCAYGMIKWKQAHMHFQDYGLDFKNPCFVKYADSYGATGHRLAATDELAPLIRNCQQQGGVHLIDIPIDYSENDRILNVELPQRSAQL
ncbi:MAG: acetolactate synthase large subunit [Verrucomicrobiales bacterium]|nr:acetolactate synthase large subunit [Verrucomicrobiales bacterium]